MKGRYFNVSVSKENQKKYIVIGSGSTLTTEYRILNSDTPDGICGFQPEFVV
jgi:oligopeptidase B